MTRTRKTTNDGSNANAPAKKPTYKIRADTDKW